MGFGELLGIYDCVCGFEIQYMKEHPLAQSIYTFSYLYDAQVARENPYVSALVTSINVFGNYFFDLAKQNMSMSNDDNTFSLFGFSKDQSMNRLMQRVTTRRSKGF